MSRAPIAAAGPRRDCAAAAAYRALLDTGGIPEAWSKLQKRLAPIVVRGVGALGVPDRRPASWCQRCGQWAGFGVVRGGLWDCLLDSDLRGCTPADTPQAPFSVVPLARGFRRA